MNRHNFTFNRKTAKNSTRPYTCLRKNTFHSADWLWSGWQVTGKSRHSLRHMGQSWGQLCPCVQVKEHRTLPQSFPKSSIAFALYIKQHGMCSSSQIWHEKVLSPGGSQFPEYLYLMHWMLQNLRPVRWVAPHCEGPTMGPCRYMWGEPVGS